ncbi:alpha/beta hydrolase family protein [Aureimonas mangrovi]|uniref:alpha/beta hydrolase family protein n=1 Tax=Aureimonas mangrovi TaxID=2758041 RepID=UPI00163D8F6F|nr:alpha/beta fold hydrolase [Aureimonas mangrovi]
MNRSRNIAIPTRDGLTLVGTLYEGSGDGPAILISSAAAVERRFYRAFAENLVEAGASAVLTYDYRGVGSSKARCRKALHMKDWGVHDMPAAVCALKKLAPNKPLVGIGHSFGGVALGLCGVSDAFERYVMVASLNGYYGRTREPLKVYARMNLLGVPMALLLGKLPKAAGLGTALPGTIFRDWAKWCRHPEFLFADPKVPEARRFSDVRIPVYSVGISDDNWGTPKAVTALLDQFSNAPVEEIWISPKDAGCEQIGHNGFFRSSVCQGLWPKVSDLLLGRNLPAVRQAA